MLCLLCCCAICTFSVWLTALYFSVPGEHQRRVDLSYDPLDYHSVSCAHTDVIMVAELGGLHVHDGVTGEHLHYITKQQLGLSDDDAELCGVQSNPDADLLYLAVGDRDANVTSLRAYKVLTCCSAHCHKISHVIHCDMTGRCICRED